jgi:hypothetical protein
MEAPINAWRQRIAEKVWPLNVQAQRISAISPNRNTAPAKRH